MPDKASSVYGEVQDLVKSEKPLKKVRDDFIHDKFKAHTHSSSQRK